MKSGPGVGFGRDIFGRILDRAYWKTDAGTSSPCHEFGSLAGNTKQVIS